MKSVELSKIIWTTFKIDPSIIHFLSYILIQITEGTILYLSFYSRKKFATGCLILISVFALISVYSYFFQIDADCGCFGEIIVLGDNFLKLIFNISNLLFSSILYLLIYKGNDSLSKISK